MTKDTKTLARRTAGAGLALLLATASVGAPGHAETGALEAPIAASAPTSPVGADGDFAGVFASYSTVPEAVPPAPGAVDVTAIAPPIGEDLGAGIASWYGPKFAGRRTANGETFDPAELTAAHKSLPFGSRVRVTDSRSGRSVVVRINDRGPFVRGRVIDLSQAAASEIGMIGAGHTEVSLALLSE